MTLILTKNKESCGNWQENREIEEKHDRVLR